MEFTKRHNQMSFYKYVSAGTAKLVLRNGKLKADCPFNFNDPFDIQTGMHYGFDISELPEMYFQRMKFLVELKEDPVFENENNFSKVIMSMREKKNSHEFPENGLRKLSGQLISELGTYIEDARTTFVNERNAFTKRMRVLCLTENYESVLMWSHYADHHKGVVIKLKVSETAEEDDCLWLAEQVQYAAQAIPLMNKDEILDEIFGIKNADAQVIVKRLNNTKFDVWSYEKEWRLWTTVDEANDGDFYIDIELKNIEAIYFGCKCSDADISEIKYFAKSGNENVEFYQAKKHAFDFKLEFEKL